MKQQQNSMIDILTERFNCIFSINVSQKVDNHLLPPKKTINNYQSNGCFYSRKEIGEIGEEFYHKLSGIFKEQKSYMIDKNSVNDLLF